MKEQLVFILEFIFSIFIPSIVFLIFLNISTKTKKIDNLEKIFISLGVGPALNIWMLNTLLFFAPNLPSYFYVIFPLLTNLVIICFYKKNILDFFKKNILNKNIYNKPEKYLIKTSILLFLIFTFFFIKNISITGSDMLLYANQGKIIARNTQINYKKIYFDEISKFSYKAHHGFSFPIFSTTNQFYNKLFNINDDLYFKSISAYYYYLIILLIFIELKIFLPLKYKKYSIFGSIFFILAPVISILLYSGSIDSYRIFLLCSSFIFLIYFLKNNKNTNIKILFGIILGLSANSHIIGLIASCIIIFSLLFNKQKNKEKIKTIFLISLFFLLFGAYHYPLQIFKGDGWIFKKEYSSTNLQILENTTKLIYSPKDSFRQKTAEFRDIDSKYKLFKNGYLGLFFRFNYFGITNIIFLILFIYYVFKIKKINYEKIFFMSFILLLIIIILKGYSNYRYNLTLLPLTISITLIFILNFFKKNQIKFIIFILLFLSLINFGFTFKNNLINYIYKYSKKNSIILSNKNEDIINIIKTKSTSDIIRFVNNLNLDNNKNILTTGTRLLNYYTNKPVYFLSTTDQIYTENGNSLICQPKLEHTYLDIKEKYKIQYVVFRTTDIRQNICFDKILNKYGLLIFDTKSYQVYEIK